MFDLQPPRHISTLRGRHRDDQLDLQLAMHSAELVKIKISSLRQFSALIAQNRTDY